ncbi:MAG TPA: GDSL-type esterase/lipase family protein, partial [Pirellulaceae bacterium]|nr:GDSL-type esterase/lipase family protein [Pirellulaceae bacterium]
RDAVVSNFFAGSAAAAAEPQSPFGDHVQFRGRLDNSRHQFTTTKKGRVAFIGGSITEMNGYRPMVCDSLKKRYPETEFTFVDAGISSTCSTTGAFRLEHDVLAGGPVDLFFIEFAVNDDQDAHHTRAECIRGLEGIIRHARRSNPNMDIVVTFFVNEGMLAKLQAGETPLTIEAHEAVARHYSVSTINLAKEVATQITAGSLTWKQYGGVHPAPHGNAICARMIDELLDRAAKQPAAGAAATSPAAHRLPEPLDPLNYERGRFLDHASAKLLKGWQIGVPDWQSLAGSKRPRFTNIPLLWANEAGAELSLEFEGTTVGAYVVAGPDAGIVEASVDGGEFRKVDLFHAYSRGLHYPRTVLLAADLKPGRHALRLRVSEETKSAGHAVRIVRLVAN